MSSEKQRVIDYLDEHGLTGDTYRGTARQIKSDLDLNRSFRSVRRDVSGWAEANAGGDGTSDEGPDVPTTSTIFESGEHREEIYYNDLDDKYIVWLQGRRENVILDGSDFRALKTAYSNWDGDEDTINQICRKFEISRRDFMDLRDAAGWTHDSAPFTDEQLLEADDDESQTELVKSLVKRRERKVHREWQKTQWRKTQKEAEKWRHFERGVLEPMLGGLGDAPKRDSQHVRPEPSEDAVCGLFFETDRHLEGRSQVGGFEEHKSIWLSALEDTIRSVMAYRQPDQLIAVLGSDQFNVDTHGDTTTAGTAQRQSLGPRDAVFEVARAGCEAIEILREVAPVTLRVLPGNHDRRTASSYLWGLQQRYADCEDVDVRGRCEPYQYERYGKNLIGLHHGDGIGGGQTRKADKLTAKMVSDVPELVGQTDHRFWHIGHEHRVWADESASLVEMAPTPKPHDEWEDYKGFPGGTKASAAYVYLRGGGQVARFFGRA